MKNFYSKNFKPKFNIFIAESLQKKIEPRVFVLSILQFIWQDLAIACRSFNKRKKYALIIGI